MGLAGATVAPLWNPYREDASKGQVTSSCNLPPSSFVPSPRNKLRASLSPYRTAPFSPSPPLCPAYSASSRSRPSRARRFAVMGAAGDRDRPIGCEARRSCGRGGWLGVGFGGFGDATAVSRSVRLLCVPTSWLEYCCLERNYEEFYEIVISSGRRMNFSTREFRAHLR